MISQDAREKILHDFRKIAQAIKYCKHDCFLADLFDKLYKDVKDGMDNTGN